MENCNGGEMFDRLVEQPESCFNEAYTRTIATAMLGALTYLHGMNVIHRDLKLENILYVLRNAGIDLHRAPCVS